MERVRRGTVAAAAVAVAVAAIIASAGAGAVAAGPGPTASANQASAERDAQLLLSRLSLPAGASQSATEPGGDGGTLAQPGTWTLNPNLVDDHRWWVLSGSAQQTLSYIDTHPPTGSEPTFRGSASGPHQSTTWSRGFGWPAVPGVLSLRWLVITVVVLDDGRTGLRADAEDEWVTPRPASEKVPPGTKLVTVSVRGLGGPPGTPRQIRSPATVRRIVSLADELPLAQGGPESCPVSLGPMLTVAFRTASGGTPLATLRTAGGGCGGVGFWIEGSRQPELADGLLVFTRLHALGAIPTCAADQLRPTSTPPAGNPGGYSLTVSLRNSSRSACALTGYPRLSLRDSADRPLAVKSLRQQGTSQLVTLARDGVAGFYVSWSERGSHCQATQARSAVVRLPGVRGAVTVRLNRPVAPCRNLSVSGLEPAP